MGKADPFTDRPKLPNREQIIADLNNAPESDVVFQDGEGLAKRLIGEDTAQDLEEPSTETVEKNYKNVTRLLELQSQLKSEPSVLQEKYEQLEKLGHDVSDSISELKSSAEVLMKK